MRERYLGPTAASLRIEVGRYMDAYEVPASHPMRADALQYAERRVDAVSKDALALIRGAIAEGKSLETFGANHGVAFMRAPRIELPQWSTEAWMKCVTTLAFRQLSKRTIASSGCSDA